MMPENGSRANPAVWFSMRPNWKSFTLRPATLTVSTAAIPLTVSKSEAETPTPVPKGILHVSLESVVTEDDLAGLNFLYMLVHPGSDVQSIDGITRSADPVSNITVLPKDQYKLPSSASISRHHDLQLLRRRPNFNIAIPLGRISFRLLVACRENPAWRDIPEDQCH